MAQALPLLTVSPTITLGCHVQFCTHVEGEIVEPLHRSVPPRRLLSHGSSYEVGKLFKSWNGETGLCRRLPMPSPSDLRDGPKATPLDTPILLFTTGCWKRVTIQTAGTLICQVKVEGILLW